MNPEKFIVNVFKFGNCRIITEYLKSSFYILLSSSNSCISTFCCFHSLQSFFSRVNKQKSL